MSKPNLDTLDLIDRLKGENFLLQHAKPLGIKLTPTGFTLNGRNYRPVDWPEVFRAISHRVDLNPESNLIYSILRGLE